MSKALPCGHTQAQHDYAQTGTLKLEPCEFSRPAPDAAMVERLKEIKERLPYNDLRFNASKKDVAWLLTTLEKLMGIGEEERK